MPKSKYPNQIDTSIEIPAVRDNIVEIGSDVLNSLRSAIFQIEKTLGINPQGAVGNSVADRIGKALDGNGNLLKEAIDKANILSGPITNLDVSKAAGIEESKLKLTYPTSVLQCEISNLLIQLDDLIATVSDLTSKLTVHINPASVNRHPATAISTSQLTNTGSSVGVVSLPADSVQGILDKVFSSHINYDGSNISETNRSHKANQVWFNNTNVLDKITSSDTQGAIEDLAAAIGGQVDVHQYQYHDNGSFKTYKTFDPSNPSRGMLLVDESPISYLKTSSIDTKQTSRVTFTSNPLAPSVLLEKSDILEIINGTSISLYQISDVEINGSGEIEYVDIYANLLEDSTGFSVGKIYKKQNRKSEFSGLLATAREYKSTASLSYTNSDIIQIANPNATFIVSNNIKPSEISILNRYFDVAVDGNSPTTMDVYDGTVDIQTIDTIIKKLNEQISENKLSISAYRLDSDENFESEIALCHNIPNTSNSVHTLTISRGSNSAIDSLGFSEYEDIVYSTDIASTYSIRGTTFSGLKSKLSAVGLTLDVGTSAVTSGTVNFLSLGIKKGDLLNIYNSVSDDGTYVILNVDSSNIYVDSTQLSGGIWSGGSSANAEFTVYKNSISISDLEFDASYSGPTAAIIEVFMNYSGDIFYNKVIEYGQQTNGLLQNILSIVDCSGSVEKYTATNTGSLLAKFNSSGDPVLSLDSGPEFNLNQVKKSYVDLQSGKFNVGLKVYINDYQDITTKLNSITGKEFTLSLIGFQKIDEKENLLIARFPYESQQSRIVGAGTSIPRVFRKFQKGTLTQSALATDAIFANQQRPLLETRSNGVVYGCNISISVTPFSENLEYLIDITSGVCYIKGKRFEINGLTNLNTGIINSDSDKVFIAVDQWGNLAFKTPDPVTCTCPFDPYNYAILGSIEWDNVNDPISYDFRMFIDQLDLRILNSITVSPQEGMGHFTDLGKAIKYAKRFTEMFPRAGAPTIHLKSGSHKVFVNVGADSSEAALRQASSDAGLWINFPVNITGEGYSTILDIKRAYTGSSTDDRDQNIDSTNAANLFIVGAGFTSYPVGNQYKLDSGFVNLSNFRMRLSSIRIYDPLIISDGSKINCGINIDNVIFDMSEKTSFGQYHYGILIDRQDSLATQAIGNISINNCQFLNSHIRTQGWAATYHRNISITNNYFRGAGDGLVDGQDNYAVYVQGSGHIFNLDDAGFQNNINFAGNTLADNNGSTTAYLDAGNNLIWGDRISRSLYVGDSLGIGSTDYVGRNIAGRHRLVVGSSYDNFDNRIVIQNTAGNDGVFRVDQGGSAKMTAAYDGGSDVVSLNYGATSNQHLTISSAGNVAIANELQITGKTTATGELEVNGILDVNSTSSFAQDAVFNDGVQLSGAGLNQFPRFTDSGDGSEDGVTAYRNFTPLNFVSLNSYFMDATRWTTGTQFAYLKNANASQSVAALSLNQFYSDTSLVTDGPYLSSMTLYGVDDSGGGTSFTMSVFVQKKTVTAATWSTISGLGWTINNGDFGSTSTPSAYTLDLSGASTANRKMIFGNSYRIIIVFGATANSLAELHSITINTKHKWLHP